MQRRLTWSQMNRLGRSLGIDMDRQPPCPGCGAPDTIVPRVVMRREDEPLKRCPVCDRYLDHDGIPLPDRFKTIIREKQTCRAD